MTTATTVSAQGKIPPYEPVVYTALVAAEIAFIIVPLLEPDQMKRGRQWITDNLKPADDISFSALILNDTDLVAGEAILRSMNHDAFLMLPAPKHEQAVAASYALIGISSKASTTDATEFLYMIENLATAPKGINATALQAAFKTIGIGGAIIIVPSTIHDDMLGNALGNPPML